MVRFGPQNVKNSGGTFGKLPSTRPDGIGTHSGSPLRSDGVKLAFSLKMRIPPEADFTDFTVFAVSAVFRLRFSGQQEQPAKKVPQKPQKPQKP